MSKKKKKEKIAPLFLFKLCTFCWWERKNIICPRVGRLSYATDCGWLNAGSGCFGSRPAILKDTVERHGQWRIKGRGSTVTFPGPRIGLPRDKWRLLLFVFYFLDKRLFSDLSCLPFKKFRTFLCELILYAGPHLVLICLYLAEYRISLGRRMGQYSSSLGVCLQFLSKDF